MSTDEVAVTTEGGGVSSSCGGEVVGLAESLEAYVGHVTRDLAAVAELTVARYRELVTRGSMTPQEAREAAVAGVWTGGPGDPKRGVLLSQARACVEQAGTVVSMLVGDEADETARGVQSAAQVLDRLLASADEVAAYAIGLYCVLRSDGQPDDDAAVRAAAAAVRSSDVVLVDNRS